MLQSSFITHDGSTTPTVDGARLYQVASVVAIASRHFIINIYIYNILMKSDTPPQSFCMLQRVYCRDPTDGLHHSLSFKLIVWITRYLVTEHCGACRRKWRLTDTDLCPCGETQTMSHIVESCPLTKVNGGLSRLHSAVKTLFRGWPVMVHDMHKRRRTNITGFPVVLNLGFWQAVESEVNQGPVCMQLSDG